MDNIEMQTKTMKEKNKIQRTIAEYYFGNPSQ